MNFYLTSYRKNLTSCRNVNFFCFATLCNQKGNEDVNFSNRFNKTNRSSHVSWCLIGEYQLTCEYLLKNKNLFHKPIISKDKTPQFSAHTLLGEYTVAHQIAKKTLNPSSNDTEGLNINKEVL